jgi:hypothetical protein
MTGKTTWLSPPGVPERGFEILDYESGYPDLDPKEI